MPRVALAVLLLAAALGCAAPAGPKLRRLPAGHQGPYTLWFDDETVKERGTAVNGAPHGEVERYHPNGNLAVRAELDHGVPQGRLEQYYPDGTLQVVEHRVDGALHGLREEYDAAGTLRLRSRFEDGRRHGPETGFHPDGSVAMRRHWRAGLGAGRWEELDPSGRLLRTEHRWLADGDEVGYLETVYAGGARVSLQTLLRRSDGSWEGWQTFWHENGAQAGYVEYRDGQRHGVDRSWSRSGRLLVEGWRVDDRRHGVWRTWDEQGRLVEEQEYSLGEPVEPGGAADPDGG